MSNNIERGRVDRLAVLDLLQRFTMLATRHMTELQFPGNRRRANRVLLSLVKAKQIQRVGLFGGPEGGKGEFYYSLRDGSGSPGQLAHNAAIADIYTAMVLQYRDQRPKLVPEGFGNPELCKGLRADLLAFNHEEVVFVEVHRGTNPLGDKLDRYRAFCTSETERARCAWWPPGARATVLIVCPTTRAVQRLQDYLRSARLNGLRVAAMDLATAASSPWAFLDSVPLLRLTVPQRT